jgi:hypothetical protein
MDSDIPGVDQILKKFLTPDRRADGRENPRNK